MGLITEDKLLDVLSKQLGLPLVTENEIKKLKINKDILLRIPLYSMKANIFMPLYFDRKNTLYVMCNDAYNNTIVELCIKIYKSTPKLVLAKKSLIMDKLAEFEREKDRTESRQRISNVITTSVHIYGLNANETVPAVKEVNYILLNAYRMRASDIHLTQEEDLAYLQYRIDGMLKLIDTYPIEKSNPLINRMKNMSSVPSTNHKRPQDGSFQVIADGYNVDMRLSVMPTVFGESVVIRILDRRYIDNLSIDDLGFTEYNKGRFLFLLNNPNGILAVTGPTGSGKTSSIHAAIKLLNNGERAIHFIEDPVEYKMSGVVATQIDEKAGLTFSKALRHLVRQDPDIIGVGETRDSEVAQTAIDAASTGQLIFTSLHTNDSVSTLSRFLNLGVLPYQLIDTFLGATAQVLVRRVCKSCGGDGCSVCGDTGYYGRIPLQEVLIFSSKMKEALLDSTSLYTLRKIALDEGLIPMIEDGYTKVKQGITTIDEVHRVTRKIGM